MNRLLKSALYLASLSKCKNFHHGALIYSGGKIIASACNDEGHLCHAETIAIRKLCEKGA